MQTKEEHCAVCGGLVPEGRKVCGVCSIKTDCKFFRNRNSCFVLTELVCKNKTCSFYQRSVK